MDPPATPMAVCYVRFITPRFIVVIGRFGWPPTGSQNSSRHHGSTPDKSPDATPCTTWWMLCTSDALHICCSFHAASSIRRSSMARAPTTSPTSKEWRICCRCRPRSVERWKRSTGRPCPARSIRTVGSQAGRSGGGRTAHHHRRRRGGVPVPDEPGPRSTDWQPERADASRAHLAGADRELGARHLSCGARGAARASPERLTRRPRRAQRATRRRQSG